MFLRLKNNLNKIFINDLRFAKLYFGSLFGFISKISG